MTDIIDKIITKEEKLTRLVKSVLNNALYKNELNQLAQAVNITEEEIIQTFLDYNLDIFSHGNEIYDQPAIRMVLHIHNLLEGSWHIARQEQVIEFIQIANPSTIIDLGFGVPSKYVRKTLQDKSAKITLCDIATPAITFAEQLLTIWDQNWQSTVEFKQGDMENTHDFVGLYDLYIFQDSIEHVYNPTSCLKKYIELSNPKTKFLLTLPICSLIPMHNIAWLDIESANKWLKSCGLSVENYSEIYTNPQIDLFSDSFESPLLNYIILCNKV
ncbi:hypothetical protein NOVO_07790 [Rickettsiales bacterium Ac37b]|nr:hypothetical protein NOVO_07790 [Rickettsiales bacterium Ac37b]